MRNTDVPRSLVQMLTMSNQYRVACLECYVSFAPISRLVRFELFLVEK